MGENSHECAARGKKREQFRRDALAAWTEYQETGRHLTGEEADRWLARLEAGEVASPPECRD